MGNRNFKRKKRNTLRVFIDSNQNIDINDCENVSKDLSYEPSLDMLFWR